MLEYTQNPRNEVRFDLPFPDYQAEPGLNQSLLKLISEDHDGCPAKLKFAADPENGYWTDSPAFALGRAVHSRVLEPERFPVEYACMTSTVKEMLFSEALEEAGVKSRAKYAQYNSWADFRDAEPTAEATLAKLGPVKRWKAEQKANGVEVLSQSDFTTVAAMNAAVMADDDCRRLVTDPSGSPEISAFAGLEIGRRGTIQAKCRFDRFNADDGTIVDLKTTVSANPHKFARAVQNYGYDIQAAFYCRVAEAVGWDVKRFAFVCVEKTTPFLTAVHYMPSDWLEYADQRLDALLHHLAACIERDEWDGYGANMLEPSPGLMSEILACA